MTSLRRGGTFALLLALVVTVLAVGISRAKDVTAAPPFRATTSTPRATATLAPDPYLDHKVYYTGHSGLFVDFLPYWVGGLPNVGYRRIAFANAIHQFEAVWGPGSWDTAGDRPRYPNGCWVETYQHASFQWHCTIGARPRID